MQHVEQSGGSPGNGDNDRNGIVDDTHGVRHVNNSRIGSGDVMDDHGHGTHCAGIIGAVGNNNYGVTGVAWTTKLMALKFIDSNGKGTVIDAVRCIDYERIHKARIINASWAFPPTREDPRTYLPALREAIECAEQDGILFVTVAPNRREGGLDIDTDHVFPASFATDNMISVLAIDKRNDVPFYSNFGQKTIHLGAPGGASRGGRSGEDILSTWPTRLSPRPGSGAQVGRGDLDGRRLRQWPGGTALVASCTAERGSARRLCRGQGRDPQRGGEEPQVSREVPGGPCSPLASQTGSGGGKRPVVRAQPWRAAARQHPSPAPRSAAST